MARFRVGQWVRLPKNVGFVGESDRLAAQIDPEGAPEPCFGDCCGSGGCREMSWPTLWTEPDPQEDGKRHVLCHVCESQMTPTSRPSAAKTLLASSCSNPLYVDDCTPDETEQLRAWRHGGLCRIIHGPGRAWWCATALGRVQLTEGE